MVFSSPIFLFGFLPVVLFLYYLSPKVLKNVTLLTASLLFYAWGEFFYLGVMLLSIVVNYFAGIAIHKTLQREKSLALAYLWVGIVINLLLLVSFKYANFLVDNFNILLKTVSIAPIDLVPIHLPLGISFFTFQAISYIVDVYRAEVEPQRKIQDLALYISLFPQLIAGPIVRYHDVAQQMNQREHSWSLFASGTQRFIIGLGKKMLIANTLGEVADNIFALSDMDRTLPVAWLGILAYSLQIYFDFSGYSDMAIGLGRMFGFTFLENFNYPYISQSLREFWKRWHISLSTWFKDYLYIPLGGNRVSTRRVYFNLFLVFFVTGFWHGASWNFIVWGMFHGVFLAIEHMGFSKILNRLWRPIQHIYLLLVVVVSWVFFKAADLSSAIDYLISMTDITQIQTSALIYAQVLNDEFVYVLLLGLLGSFPWAKLLPSKESLLFIELPRIGFLFLILLLSILKISSSTYNPFIYFRF